MKELEEIYKRCDVSNNQVNALTYTQFEQALQSYINKQLYEQVKRYIEADNDPTQCTHCVLLDDYLELENIESLKGK